MERTLLDKKISEIITERDIINHFFVEFQNEISTEDLKNFFSKFDQEIRNDIKNELWDIMSKYYQEWKAEKGSFRLIP